MRPRLSRGMFIRLASLACLGAAGAGAAACSGLRSAAARTSASASSPPLTLDVSGLLASVPGLMSRYIATHPGVHWVLPTLVHGFYALPAQPGFELWSGIAWESDVLTWSGEPLDTALHQRNFNPSILQPGAASSFSWRGQTYALPVTAYPWGVQWRADVFAAAGLGDPAPDWTLDDFTQICSELVGYARSGTAPAIATPLGPLGGQEFLWNPPQGFTGSAAFGDWGLWTGFALGFGGRPVVDGRFQFTDAGTVQGLGRLVDLARRFAAPPLHLTKGPMFTPAGIPTIPPLPAGACDSTRPYAMMFTPYVPALGALSPAAGCTPVWRWARLPRFPADPVIPTAMVGVGLQDGHATRTKPPMPVAQALPYIQATVDLALWLYGAEAQALLAAGGLPPVVSDAHAQARFWTQVAPAARAVGDWTHFRPYSAGWPALPPANLVGDALAQSVADPAQLPALLARAEQQANAWVQQGYASSSG